MSDMGEMFRELRSARQEKCFKNKINGKVLLTVNGIPFKSCSDTHLQINTKKGVINYYPSTGLWFYSNSKYRQRGIKKLIKHYFDTKLGD
ncbi:hypothetical protein [Avibacterium sp. 21-594]|uniref:hypothetical protein n=1 Tax=Avibacterium sp. 21-594 TaxID=2911535 RepID=UPI0022469954|nr:hypothetical protein [Avibacterium sp. 21-594]MCW9716804.1 hypothetical protein [Avibacterium sp. 21-594]